MSGITITDTSMSSPDTSMSSPANSHTATTTGGGWTVSWLPGHTLDRNQAITAMTIADIVGDRGVPRADDAIWMHLDAWGAELGLTAPAAVAQVSQLPAELQVQACQEPHAEK
jgi:hypothetical protein